jgi:Tfp pilus assembly protein FimT
VPPESSKTRVDSFTLIELVSVIAILGLLSAFLLPAIASHRTAGHISNAAHEVAGVLDAGRAYAMANNTYVWVGLYEESATASGPSNATPPYPGQGRIILATVASRNGTNDCQDPNSTTTNRIPLIPNQIAQVGRLTVIENLHLTDIGPPQSFLPNASDPNSINGRPKSPYAFGSPTIDYQNRISSDDTHTPFNQTLCPFSIQEYTFYKTIRFNPRGEANINGTYALRRVAEIGLRPTHGNAVDLMSNNVVAIQFGGLSGKCRIYRQ